MRAYIYARDSGRCRWCGRTNAGIHIHHVLYRSEGGKHVAENLICLCPNDHGLVHSDKPVYQPLLLELLQGEVNITGLQLLRWKQTNVETAESLPQLRDLPSGDREGGSSTFGMPGSRQEGKVGRLFQAPEQQADDQRNSLSSMQQGVHAEDPTDIDSETNLR